MNLKDFVTTFEEVNLTDPFDQKESFLRIEKKIENYKYSKQIYANMTKTQVNSYEP